ncbi:hypothetical protein Rumeso_02043 [Rubellimicrobium mesophilum DSM 19309]|uniref:Uncharacterized protein n=1 Tax=Rubellimicrobium mesophilum DSM 19309 TaxID=442562 RepID=A0A017HRI6_9RHOB|nr:hypothetical protein Rumeso_02043 [Rubellimicrobium mesophilum DSM 19309]
MGYLLATGQTPIPLVDALVHILIMGSLLLLAGAITFPIRLPLREAVSTMAMFGSCHGYVHGLEAGLEMPGWFGLGSIMTATALLSLGVIVGLTVAQSRRSP